MKAQAPVALIRTVMIILRGTLTVGFFTSAPEGRIKVSFSPTACKQEVTEIKWHTHMKHSIKSANRKNHWKQSHRKSNARIRPATDIVSKSLEHKLRTAAFRHDSQYCNCANEKENMTDTAD
jgi:hypothetical protein